MTNDDKRKRRLAMAAETPGPLDRHPDDGFELAEPYPLGPATLRVARGVAEAIVPDAPAPTEEGLLDLVVDHLRVMLQYMPALTARGFVLTLWLLELAPLWRFEAFSRLSRLPRERARTVLRGLAGSRFLPLRLLMLGPQGLFLSTYFDQDVVHRRLGYDPVTFMRGRIALRERLERGEVATEADLVRRPPELGASDRASGDRAPLGAGTMEVAS